MRSFRFCGQSLAALLVVLALGVASSAAPAAASSLPASTTSPQFGDLQRTIAVQSAQAYIDGAGLHELAEGLMQATAIDPGTIGTVRNVLTVAALVPWPAELAPAEQSLATALTTLETALIGNDLAAAQQTADPVHEAAHDLSAATYEWLATNGAS